MNRSSRGREFWSNGIMDVRRRGKCRLGDAPGTFHDKGSLERSVATGILGECRTQKSRAPFCWWAVDVTLGILFAVLLGASHSFSVFSIHENLLWFSHLTVSGDRVRMTSCSDILFPKSGCCFAPPGPMDPLSARIEPKEHSCSVH